MIGQWKTVIEVTTLHQVQKLHDFALDKTESLVKWKKKKSPKSGVRILTTY